MIFGNQRKPHWTVKASDNRTGKPAPVLTLNLHGDTTEEVVEVFFAIPICENYTPVEVTLDDPQIPLDDRSI